MKKNLIIIILAIAFITSFSWNWVGKAKANSDSIEKATEAINTYVGNGGVYSGVSGGGGRLQIFFAAPPEQQASFLTVTIINIDEEDIDYVINP
jgi:hypothetical protein